MGEDGAGSVEAGRIQANAGAAMADLDRSPAPVRARARMTLQPLHFGPPSRRLFGVHHPARGAARAALLMCPPLLHEHVRSYRFFSQLADRFAEDGAACLRFDYYGTGDSDGADDAFTPQSALADIAVAAAELRRRHGEIPLVLLGIRASALFAARAAGDIEAAALWVWQPVHDGRAFVEGLAARYREELASRERFPSRKAPAPAQAGDLMGFRLSPAFAEELGTCRLDDAPAHLPLAVIGDDDAMRNAPPGAAHHPLPPAATAWADQIDLRGLIALRDVEPAVQTLLRDLAGAPDRRQAYG